MNSHQAITRELINKVVTPEEERAYLTWWAARPPEEAIAMREYSVAMRGLFGPIRDFMENKTDTAAPEVQALVDHWNELALRHGLRKTMLDLLEWDTSVARKWMDVGERALSRTPSSADNPADRGLWGYFMAAVRASGWHQALMKIVDESVLLAKKKLDPSSAPVKALANRLAQICVNHSLGDPVVYARWSSAMQRSEEADVDAERKAAWSLLANAIQPEAPS